MNASQAIRMLDAALAKHGEDIVLKRITGTTNQTTVSVTCRAFVRGFAPQEQVAGLGAAHGDRQALIAPTLVIISTTQIDAAVWPAAPTSPAPAVDPRIPRRGDIMVMGGRNRVVQSADAVSLGGIIVRINVQVMG
jgi:hypothetical protein